MTTLLIEQAEKAAKRAVASGKKHAAQYGRPHSHSPFETVDWQLQRSLGVPKIDSYADARRHWDEQPAVRKRDPSHKNAGFAKAKNRDMYLLPDGSIEFRYYGAAIAVWHPDDTVRVTACPEQRNGDMPFKVQPSGVYENRSTRVGQVIYLIPRAKGESSWNRWANMWTTVTGDDGTVQHIRNPDALVVRGRKQVHLQRAKEGWRPVNADDLEPFQWQELDQKAARTASRDAGFVDLVAAMDAMIKLGTPLPTYDPTITRNEIMRRMEARDLHGAMAGLEREANRRWVQGTGYVPVENPGISKKAIERMRTSMYLQCGVLVERSEKILTLPQLQFVEGQLKRFC